jgi:maltose alpha-D-glucosyltransferase/alpha-amylase
MSEPSEAVVALVGTYLESARLLGQRTGELHLALSSETEDPAFVPEPFTPFYQRGLYQSMRNLGVQTFQTLRQSLSRVPETERALAEEALRRQPEILERFQAVHQTRLRARRIRCHGDYHLGQTLHTGKDFIILDFEGEPARALSERRIKRTPLRDVAGMLRSFHYVTYAALDEQHKSAALPPDRASLLESWANFWYCHVSAEFLRAYFAVLAGTEVLPESSEETRVLLEASLLEKAVYEIGYELHNRPTWLRIPLRGVLQLLQREIK